MVVFRARPEGRIHPLPPLINRYTDLGRCFLFCKKHTKLWRKRKLVCKLSDSNIGKASIYNTMNIKQTKKQANRLLLFRLFFLFLFQLFPEWNKPQDSTQHSACVSYWCCPGNTVYTCNMVHQNHYRNIQTAFS